MAGEDESRGDQGYPLGVRDAERQRLREQDEVMAPHSEYLFRLSGIGPGMRVLDVGCGVGATTALLASWARTKRGGGQRE